MTKLTVAFQNFANVPKMRVPTLSVGLEQQRKGHSQTSHEAVCVESYTSCWIKYRPWTLRYSSKVKPTILWKKKNGLCYCHTFNCVETTVYELSSCKRGRYLVVTLTLEFTLLTPLRPTCWSYLRVEAEDSITLQWALQPTLTRALRLQVLLQVIQRAERRVARTETDR